MKTAETFDPGIAYRFTPNNWAVLPFRLAHFLTRCRNNWDVLPFRLAHFQRVIDSANL
jgi:hypothetical protein